MTRRLSILIACCLLIGLQANAQTNLPAWSPPPPPLEEGQTWTNSVEYRAITVRSSENPVTNVTLIKTADYTNAPPFPTEEQLAFARRVPQACFVSTPPPPPADPRYVVRAYSDLTGEPIEVTIRAPGAQGFFKGGLEVDP